MRGRKPKPTHLRIIEGNREHRPLNHDEPVVDGNLAEPPEHLTARQQYYWRDCLQHAPPGMLKRLDAGAVTVYVTALADLEAYSAKVEQAGAVIQMPGPSGAFMHNPFVSLKRAAMANVLKAGAELGFTPSSRSRVKITGRKKTPGALGRLRELKLT